MLIIDQKLTRDTIITRGNYTGLFHRKFIYLFDIRYTSWYFRIFLTHNFRRKLVTLVDLFQRTFFVVPNTPQIIQKGKETAGTMCYKGEKHF